MNRIFSTATACVLLATTTACEEKRAEAENAPSATMVSEADAAAAADATQAAWTSMDVPKIESVFAKDVVAFSPVTAPLATTWDEFHKRQERFAALKMDKIEVADRNIQILDADTFVVSGIGNLTSSDGEENDRTVRFTHVYQKQDDGSWKIVTAHRSFAPEENEAST